VGCPPSEEPREKKSKKDFKRNGKRSKRNDETPSAEDGVSGVPPGNRMDGLWN
jgi:hypothetical protein